MSDKLYNKKLKKPRVGLKNRSLAYGTSASFPRDAMHTFNKQRKAAHQKSSSLMGDDSRRSKFIYPHAVWNKLPASAKRRTDVRGLDDGVGSVGYWHDLHKRRKMAAFRKETAMLPKAERKAIGSYGHEIKRRKRIRAQQNV
jgi:hypothetical protein